VRTLLVALSALVLGGCAVGRTASYADAAVNLPGASVSNLAVALAVQDRRPYVVSGNKPEKFVGLQRGGFGNPFDVNTSSGAALATDLRDSIAKALKAKGYNVTAVTVAPGDANDAARRKLADARAKRSALVVLTELKSDSYMNSSVAYDMTLTVLDERGNAVASNTVRGEDNVSGSGMIADESKITQHIGHKLEQLFADPKVTAALR
jgi:mannose/fructose-specific phosphotransferase system component IIA